MSGRLVGKRAVVTGAAGGIGSTAARAFALEGALVGLMDRLGNGLNAIVQELGDSAMALPVDLTDEGSVESGFAAGAETKGGLDVI